MKQIQPRTYKKIDFPPLTAEQEQEVAELNAMKDSDIDYSDIPQKLNTPIIQYYKPTVRTPKKSIHILFFYLLSNVIQFL